nr:MAG TPA: hypothetical protein [Caudoviricetes sp.]
MLSVPPVPLRRAGGFALSSRGGCYEGSWSAFGAWAVPAYGWSAVRRSDWLPWPLVRVGACVAWERGAVEQMFDDAGHAN